MDADVLTTRVVDGIAVITLGTERRIYIDQETSDALFETLNQCAGDADIRVVIVTGAAPGSFVRHYSIPELIRFAESVRATGREWPEARFIDGPISVCESMPKPVIAAISGTCLAGAFELTLSCDLRIAEDGDYQIGFPEPNFGLVPGAGGTQRLARTIGTPAALMHILMGAGSPDVFTAQSASSLGCVLAPRHAGRNPGHPRVNKSVLRERSYRRSEEDRCADADPAR